MIQLQTRPFGGRARKVQWMPIAFVLPTVIILLALSIYPLVYSVWLSFHSYEMAFSPVPQFIGLGNFARILGDERFLHSLKNTGLFVGIGVGLQLVLGLVFALALNRQKAGLRRVLTSLFLLPMIVPPVVAGFQWRMILHESFGPLNYLLDMLGWRGRAWLADSNVALYAVIAADTWEWTPFLTLILLAGLSSIPGELYEAARVDGAGHVDMFRLVILPLLKPVMLIGVLIRGMDAFRFFDILYVLTGGGPGNATETLSLYTYITGFRFFSLGYAAAMAILQVVVITIVAQLFLRLLRDREGVWS